MFFFLLFWWFTTSNTTTSTSCSSETSICCSSCSWYHTPYCTCHCLKGHRPITHRRTNNSKNKQKYWVKKFHFVSSCFEKLIIFAWKHACFIVNFLYWAARWRHNKTKYNSSKQMVFKINIIFPFFKIELFILFIWSFLANNCIYTGSLHININKNMLFLIRINIWIYFRYFSGLFRCLELIKNPFCLIFMEFLWIFWCLIVCTLFRNILICSRHNVWLRHP